MSALIYLLKTLFVNRIKDLKNNKGKLVLYIIMIASFILIFVTGNKVEETSEFSSLDILYAIFFGLNATIFYLTAKNGFTVGATFYNMADVNFAFMSPTKPQHILYYGIIKQMGSTLLAGIFIFFQYSTLHMNFGFSVGDVFLLLFGYALALFSGQITALLIYSNVNGKPKKKKNVKYIFNGAFVLLAAYIAYATMNSDDILNTLVSVVNQDFMNYIPVAGWTNILFRGLYSSNIIWTDIFIGLGLDIGYIVLIIYIINKTNLDFYEDVLQSTERNTTAIAAAKENRSPEMIGNVKTGKTGINKGFGSSAFFFKHLLEERRINFIFISKVSIIFTIGICVAGYLVGDNEYFIYGVLGFSVYMMFFLANAGRWTKDMNKPYIYMIPEPPFKKLLWLSAESILKTFIDGILFFIPVAIIIHLSPLTAILAALSYFSFGMIIISVNFLVQKLFGASVSKVVIVFLYLFFTVVISAPGLVLGFVMAARFSGLNAVSAFSFIITPSIITNLILSFVIMYLCRNVLSYVELK